MKRIVFVTGTRADFGKLKPLIAGVDRQPEFEAHLFVTGMHMLARYGLTVREVEKSGFRNIYRYINQRDDDDMDIVLAKTIQGLSDFLRELQPHLLVVHGDRVETLAGAIVGSLNNNLVAHIEGGEVSGTIDEVIRHSVSKMSHLHFVSNDLARRRLLQLGELPSTLFVIGSPDLDVMRSPTLPTLQEVRRHYDIPFADYHLMLFHPVTTELHRLHESVEEVVAALRASGEHFVVIYPCNDPGSRVILDAILPLAQEPGFRVFPSMRFEHFLTLVKHARSVVGNSSAGVREAPFYGVPSINIGSRQSNRAQAPTILNVAERREEILNALRQTGQLRRVATREFGQGNSAQLFLEALKNPALWMVSHQKQFVDIPSLHSARAPTS